MRRLWSNKSRLPWWGLWVRDFFKHKIYDDTYYIDRNGNLYTDRNGNFYKKRD